MIVPVKEKKMYGHIKGIGHVWVNITMTRFGAVLQLDMFCSSVTSTRTRLEESDTFEGKDTFLSFTYIAVMKILMGTTPFFLRKTISRQTHQQ